MKSWGVWVNGSTDVERVAQLAARALAARVVPDGEGRLAVVDADNQAVYVRANRLESTPELPIGEYPVKVVIPASTSEPVARRLYDAMKAAGFGVMLTWDLETIVARDG